jgi:nicotinamidase-related amidase
VSDRSPSSPYDRRPDPRHCLALLLVDVDNAFFDPRGAFFYPVVEAVIGPLRELLAAARAGGRLVVHARERHHVGLTSYRFTASKTISMPCHSPVSRRCAANQ